MRKSIRKLWVTALRSGAYKQGTAGLRFESSFCCLGVLCDLHSKAAFVAWEQDEESGIYRYMGETIVLPKEVCAWAGLETQNPAVPKIFLTTQNDARRSFKRVAGMIERHL
jgi:hypothetical protein